MPHRTIPDAVAAHSLGLELFVIGVTSFVNVSEVRLMSSPPQQENATYWLLPTFQTLDSVVEMIRDDLCTGKHKYTTLAVRVFYTRKLGLRCTYIVETNIKHTLYVF